MFKSKFFFKAPHKFVQLPGDGLIQAYGRQGEATDNSFVDLDLNRLSKEFDEYDRYKKGYSNVKTGMIL